MVVRRATNSRAVRQSSKTLDKLLNRHHLDEFISVNNKTGFATLQVVVEATVGFDKLSYILNITVKHLLRLVWLITSVKLVSDVNHRSAKVVVNLRLLIDTLESVLIICIRISECQEISAVIFRATFLLLVCGHILGRLLIFVILSLLPHIRQKKVPSRSYQDSSSSLTQNTPGSRCS